MARKKEVEAPEQKMVVVPVEVKSTLVKPSPKPSPAPPQKSISTAPLANPFDLLDEDSSDLISIVDAKEDDAFVAAERKRIEEEKKQERQAKIQAKEEEKKAAREAKKRALQEKKIHDASILGFHSARPIPSFSRGPISLPSDGVQSHLAKNPSGVELQAKESQGSAVEDGVASVDGSSSMSSDGRRRANVNGSMRRKLKKKAGGDKKEEGDDHQEKQNIVASPVENNYPRSYTLKEYEERKKREEAEKNKKTDAIDAGMDHAGPRRLNNAGPRKSNNAGPRRVFNGGQRFYKEKAHAGKAIAETTIVKSDASFSLVDADFPVLGIPVGKNSGAKKINTL